jgi:hypothetical protein
MANYLTLDLKKLLGLLNARSRYKAEDWVAWDVIQTKRGWTNGFFDVEYCDASAVMYGSKDG